MFCVRVGLRPLAVQASPNGTRHTTRDSGGRAVWGSSVWAAGGLEIIDEFQVLGPVRKIE